MAEGTQSLILVVDDQKDFQEIIGERLKAAGFLVDFASNAKEAVEKAESLQPKLILMDIDLGEEMRGTDVALSLRENPKTKDIKIAFLSSLSDPWPAISGNKGDVSREMGMEDFLDKGGDLNQNMERIKAMLASGK